jgi:hypothetical protein
MKRQEPVCCLTSRSRTGAVTAELSGRLGGGEFQRRALHRLTGRPVWHEACFDLPA